MQHLSMRAENMIHPLEFLTATHFRRQNPPYPCKHLVHVRHIPQPVDQSVPPSLALTPIPSVQAEHPEVDLAAGRKAVRRLFQHSQAAGRPAADLAKLH